MSAFYIDFHCHPSMKPYGKSFNYSPSGENSAITNNENSIWHYNPPNLLDRAIQSITGISKFTQSDFSSLTYGDVRIVCASLYPIERGFFRNKLGQWIIGDLVDNFITGVGEARVNKIQGITNYFEDVCKEYNFYLQLNGTEIETSSGTFKYLVVNSSSEIENYLASPNGDKIIFVIITIEGLHILNSNIDSLTPDSTNFISNLRTIKNWQHPPFFVTFAHHFYNHLCGHAKSLDGIVGKEIDQSEGMNSGFTPLGKEVLREVLSNTNGKRILIDIKHMSAQSRQEYFTILQDEYANEKIPVIASHAAANGLISMKDPNVSVGSETGYKMLAEDINFYDEEILIIARSSGIFGLQLDERRIGSVQTVKDVKHSVSMNKIRHYRAELVWNQIQHIVELLDRNNLFAWDCICLGTDFEGIINPLNGFLTSETLVNLEEYLERYVYDYMNDKGKLLKSYNQLDSSSIVNRIFYSNGMAFIRKHFN